jgi:enoyl-CoA hydratase/carnithine racemase
MSETPEELVHVERGADGVAVITLRHGKVNALSVALLQQLRAAAEDLTADPPGAVVVTGGDRIFAAGAEITEFLEEPDERPSRVADRNRLTAQGHAFLTALNAVAAIPRATFAEVAGFALGGGCELALACDFRIASERAKLGQPEILLGIIPGGGGTQRLARLVGPARAKDLILTGRQVGAEEALAIGLVDEVVPADDLSAHVRAKAAALAGGAVLAQALAKRAVDDGLERSLAEGLTLEQELFLASFATDDAATGINSFLEQGPGKATFTGN